MEQVEAAIGEDDRSARATILGEGRPQRVTIENPPHERECTPPASAAEAVVRLAPRKPIRSRSGCCYTPPPPMADYRRKRWRTEMAVRVDVNGALESL